MKPTKTISNLATGAAPLALALGLAGCGAAVAPEALHTARDTVSKADTPNAARLAPVQLDDAKQALARAEAAFKDGEDDQTIEDLAYVAQRKADLALSAANLEVAKRDVAQAKQDREAAKDGALAGAQAQLTQTKDALAAEQRRAEEEKRRAEEEKQRLEEAKKMGAAEVDRVRKELAAEKAAREAAEAKAAAALASLQDIANVKEEKRGVVITLSGSVLFATGEYHLLAIAREKLDEVAKALKDQGFSSIVVEGHTDSRGSPSKNEALSLQRAQEVRNHLVGQGIPHEKISAVGHGSRRPVAENDTPDGRANNRRVEIVVTPE